MNRVDEAAGSVLTYSCRECGGIAKWLRRRTANPLFPSSNLGAASKHGREGKTAFPAFSCRRSSGQDGPRGCRQEYLAAVGRCDILRPQWLAAGVEEFHSASGMILFSVHPSRQWGDQDA